MKILRATTPNQLKDFEMVALKLAEIGYQNHLKEVAMIKMCPDDYRIHNEATFIDVGFGGSL